MKRLKRYENVLMVIYDFMVTSLGLCGAELIVFAALYSFTRGDEGEYYGTRAYLSKRLGISERTLSRTLTALVQKGLIAKSQGRFTRIHTPAYVVCPDAVLTAIGSRESSPQGGQNGTNAEDERAKTAEPASQNDNTDEPKRHTQRAKMAEPTSQNGRADSKEDSEEDSKEDNEKETLSVRPSMNRQKKEISSVKWTEDVDFLDDDPDDPYGVSEHWGEQDGEEAREELMAKTYRVGSLGRDRTVRLTDGQYRDLLSLAPPEVIDDYIQRIDSYSTGSGGRVNNPYRTIIGWLKEDYTCRRKAAKAAD